MMNPSRISLKKYLDTRSEDIQENIASRILSGSLFIYPTETIYGLGGIVEDNIEKKIFIAKRRRPNQPLLLIAGALSCFNELQLVVNDTAQKLMDQFWPGNLTLIFSSKIDNATIGVRLSNHPFLIKLSEKCSKPIFSTSANLTGEPYLNNPDFIYSLFLPYIDFMVDAGELASSVPSTVVDVTDHRCIKILRKGIIPSAAIESII